MKRIVRWIVGLFIVSSFSITALAADMQTAAEDMEAVVSQEIRVPISLSNCENGDTLGITLQYDKNVLELLSKKSEWNLTGQNVLQTFDARRNAGVWASENVEDLNGTVCTLVFRVKDTAALGDTTIGYSLVAQKDSTNVGNTNGAMTVSIICHHEYGPVENVNDLYHRYICTKCGEEDRHSHGWVETVLTEATISSTGLMQLDCTECGASTTAEIPKLSSNSGNDNYPGSSGSMQPGSHGSSGAGGNTTGGNLSGSGSTGGLGGNASGSGLSGNRQQQTMHDASDAYEQAKREHEDQGTKGNGSDYHVEYRYENGEAVMYVDGQRSEGDVEEVMKELLGENNETTSADQQNDAFAQENQDADELTEEMIREILAENGIYLPEESAADETQIEGAKKNVSVPLVATGAVAVAAVGSGAYFGFFRKKIK